MKEYELTGTLVLRGPVLTKATAMGKLGIDAAMAKGPDGKWYLPGTLVKGKLREAWKELASLSGGEFAPAIRELLGPDPPAGETDLAGAGQVPNSRGTMRFDDFVCQTDGTADRRSYRIRMDPATGTVDTGAYLVIESPFTPGQSVTFKGAMYLAASSDESAGRIAADLQKGLAWAAAYGSLRSVGFGALLSSSVSQPVAVPARQVTAATGVKRFGIRLLLDRPFCIAKRRPTSTLFESEEVIPGGVLRGALASLWMTMLGRMGAPVTADVDPSRKELAEHFSLIRISHAFPVPETKTKRPVVPPFSAVQVRGHTGDPPQPPFFDLAIRGGPCLLYRSAPDYAPDAKNWGAVRRHFGWTEAPSQIRVRTQMNRETRSARKGLLFAYEMKVPKGFAWLAEVDLSALPDDDVRATVEAQLRELLAYPLRDIGKTKARATAELLGPVEPAVLSHLAPVEGLSILTLQTPALLLNPEGLSEASTEEHLRQRYEETWRKHLPGLTLRRYFARQTLAGGVYLHHRFLAGREYRPFILTDAGSVFVFEGDSPKLGDYLRQGLPNAQWVQHWYGGDCAEADLWKHCPYIRENGFGEIALNLSSHTEYNPPEEIYHAVHTLEN